ncbi:hypothetical protein GA0070620_3078 [Micromonospora krabiensis]|uniref:Phage terminase, small subunit, putative, P27 family n=2 Tax=Micromonospora krabiensis TaxID=307121 RepID=A0A1C3N4P3_9ACTN|nr:hypothetical protein GA0070620_3078 [Micromonospora krabiensis]
MPQPPKHDPARRNARVGPVLLPAEGRKGEPPVWPLPGKMSGAEREAWAQLWATPQAVAWEQMGWTRTVARYCRVMVAAEKTDATAALLAQVTALEDRLGLTPKSMRLLLWQIASDEVGVQREKSQGARDRIKAVG